MEHFWSWNIFGHGISRITRHLFIFNIISTARTELRPLPSEELVLIYQLFNRLRYLVVTYQNHIKMSFLGLWDSNEVKLAKAQAEAEQQVSTARIAADERIAREKVIADKEAAKKTTESNKVLEMEKIAAEKQKTIKKLENDQAIAKLNAEKELKIAEEKAKAESRTKINIKSAGGNVLVAHDGSLTNNIDVEGAKHVAIADFRASGKVERTFTAFEKNREQDIRAIEISARSQTAHDERMKKLENLVRQMGAENEQRMNEVDKSIDLITSIVSQRKN